MLASSSSHFLTSMAEFLSTEYLSREFAKLVSDEKAMVALAITAGVVALGSAYVFSLGKRTKKLPVALDPDKWTSFKLVELQEITHNTKLFRFALPSPEHVLGLPVGQHVSIQGIDSEGMVFTRPYTPTTLDSDVGVVDLVVKLYPQGAMSQVLAKLKVGDYLPFRGPKGKFKYTPNSVRAFGMIAGGSGITPMYQVARAILENPKDTTTINLLYGNVTEEDILLREELDKMAKDHPDRFSVYYILNQPPEGWAQGVGFVTSNLIRNWVPPPANDIKILYCGPPGMNKAMAEHLENLGYSKEMLFKF